MPKKNNCTVELKKYAQRAHLELKYEDVGSEGSEHNKRFVMRAVISGQVFPIGVGNTKKQAKLNAAKIALRSMSEKENQKLAMVNPAKNPTAPVHQTCVTKANYVSLLNIYGQKKGVNIRAVQSPRLAPNNATQCCRFVVGDKEYPAATGKIWREAKEEAAKLAYQEICCSTNTEEQNPVVKPKILFATDLQDASSSEDAVIPEKVTTGNSPIEKTSTQSEMSRFTSGFDCIEPLGKGAFGHVFKAKEELTGKFYAVKIVVCRETKKDLREAIALSDLHPRNIVRYYTCWLEDSGYQWDNADDSGSSSQSSIESSMKYLYIQMELCDTKTLRVWIDEKNTKNVMKSPRDSKRRHESLTIVQQMVSALEYIHSKKFIHRDLKPANILFGQDGEWKIGDFGLVTEENDDNDKNLMERTGYRGTPSYMAPEQKSKRNYDRKIDIFSLGLIYFELLHLISTGHEREAVWGDVRTQTFPEGFQRNLPQEYIIIRSMLCEKPEERPEASKLKTDLEECRLNTLETAVNQETQKLGKLSLS